MKRGSPWVSDEHKGFIAGLIFIALISAIPRLLLATSQSIEYDGYWHVFIAQQDKWSNFWEDIRVNAHPPLFFLILKFIIHFGRSVLIYCSISLVTGVISVFSVGWIARKITQSDLWACAAALAYGLAMPAIVVSCEVRSYMLSTLFILLSFSFLLELAVSPGSGREIKLRTWFVLTAILACLSHYFAFFYAGAASLLLALRYAERKFRGQHANWKLELATILPLPAVIVLLYETHANLKAFIQSHLAPFYYDPKGTESISSFLVRNWKNLLNLFLPWQISSDAIALVIFAISALCGVLFVSKYFRDPTPAAVRTAWSVLTTAGILAEIAFTAVAGKYPFGGDLRQQFILFPFFVVCAAAVADSLTARIPGKGRITVAGVAAIALVIISVVRFEQYPKDSENVWSDRIRAFNNVVPDPAGVYVDQVNLITFFIYHHDWQWTSLRQQPVPGIDIYRVRRGLRQMLVFRDLSEWNIRPDNAEFYRKLAECLKVTHVAEISIFGALQTPPAEMYSDFKVMGHGIAKRAAGDSICVQQLQIKTDGWYGTFRESGCTAPALAPPRVNGVFDDNAEEIIYSGAWSHGSYSHASDGTTSYSNFPGATVHLDFVGTAVTWMYAKAPNRGVAAIRIDGNPRADVDLYSPTIIWQARTTFSGLSPGNHSLELMVSGRKDGSATDRYIDIDTLIAQ